MGDNKIKVPDHLKGQTIYTKFGKFDMDGDISQANLKKLQELGCLEPPKGQRTVQVSKK